MKKFLFAFLLLAISSTVPIWISLAETSDPPKVDDVLSPADANKAIITGTTEPGAKIIVTGGMYQISPVIADNKGNFEVTVALVQESTNTFYVQAQVGAAYPSDSVEVVIVEGVAAVEEYEASTGEDHTAPNAPEIETSTVETSGDTYKIEGSGEEGALVLVDEEDSGVKVENGIFSVEVSLSGGGEQDIFSISLRDETGNVSSGVKVYITSIGEESNEESALSPLTDISEHWAEDYIQELYEDGVVSGYGAGRFGPDDTLTRAQIVKIAVLAFELPRSGAEEKFNDVNGEDWFADYVGVAAELAIVNGYSDGSFKPNNPVTRAEALKVILEAAGEQTEGALSPNFSDVNTVNDWFASYTAYAKATGLLSGYEDGSFRGNQSITRAEVCKIVVELLKDLM